MSFSERTAIIYGPAAIARISRATVALFGLGGVGAAAAVDLIRAGVGRLVVTDFDAVHESNLNRLAIGFTDTIGQDKTTILRETARRINPAAVVEGNAIFLRGDSVADNIPEADLYLDAIDALNPKVNLIATLLRSGRPFLSVLGTAGRRDPTRLQVTDIWKTHGCPLGYFVRKRLRKQGIGGRFPVIFSPEPPVDPIENPDQRDDGKGRIRRIQGSTPFVPQAAGHIAAWWIVEKILSSSPEAS